MKIKVYEIRINEDVPDVVWYAKRKGELIDTVLSAKHFNEHSSKIFAAFKMLTQPLYINPLHCTVVAERVIER